MRLDRGQIRSTRSILVTWIDSHELVWNQIDQLVRTKVWTEINSRVGIVIWEDISERKQ